MKFTNKDMVFVVWVLLIVGAIYALTKHTKLVIRDTQAPLYVNRKTTGNANGNSMDVSSYKNFREQPYG